MMKLIVILVVVLTVIEHAHGRIVCRPDTCSLVRCANATKETCCGPNKEIRDGSCGCCKICFTYLDEGEKCPPVLYGGGPPTSGCKKGLKCIDGKCRK